MRDAEFWLYWRDRYPNSPLLQDAPPSARDRAAERRQRQAVDRAFLANREGC